MNKEKLFKSPNEKLPKLGERVITMVIKEMVYQGDPSDSDNDSQWLDDGDGYRAIMAWTELFNLEYMKEGLK